MRCLLLYVFVVILFASCNPIYYIPKTQNVPLLSEKGEFNGSFQFNFIQIELQGAYALTNDVGILVNTGIYPLSSNGTMGKYADVGIGYFTRLSEESDFMFETYGLYGIGNINNIFPATVNDYPNTTGNLDVIMHQYGIQPAIAYKRKNIEVAFSTKYSYLNYGKIKGSLIHKHEDQNQYIQDHRTNILLEPAFTFRFGFNSIKFTNQIGRSFNLNHPDFKQDRLFATGGIIITF